MPKFRKRPVVIDAVQFKGQHIEGVEVKGLRDDLTGAESVWGEITTLEGIMRAVVGDWIITGVQGEKYPIKEEIFLATYERVSDEPR